MLTLHPLGPVQALNLRHSTCLSCVCACVLLQTSQLRQICSKFHIDITMPPKGDDTSTTVLLQGYEERCRNAAAEIERILEDMVRFTESW